MSQNDATIVLSENDEKVMTKKLNDFRKKHIKMYKEYVSRNPTEVAKRKSKNKGGKSAEPPKENLIGYRLWFLRRNRGFSQEELAQSAKVSRSTVMRCETEGVAPIAKNLEKLITALDTSVDEFVADYDGNEFESHFYLEEITENWSEIENLRKHIHFWFEQHTIMHTCNGHTKFMSEADELLLLQQFDTAIDLAESMLAKTQEPKKKIHW